MIGATSSRTMDRPEGQIRDFDESKKHRRAIRRLAMAYERDGYNVRADHIDRFEHPEKCNVMKPDLMAEKDGEKVLIEVETGSSIGTRRDKMQRDEFSEWAKKESNRDFRREIVL